MNLGTITHALDTRRGHSAQLGRHRRLIAVAAGVVVLVAGGIGTAVAVHHHGNSGGCASQGAIRMHVDLASQNTGTALRVEVSGLPADEHCTLIAIAKDGSRDVAGRWDATYSGRAQVTGSTEIPKSQLAQLVLLGSTGQHLVTVNV